MPESTESLQCVPYSVARGFSTAKNDVWALGIILLGILTGSYPWTLADCQVESFRNYLCNPSDYLHRTYPTISCEARDLLCRIMTVYPRDRISLLALHAQFSEVETFFETLQLESYQASSLFAKVLHNMPRVVSDNDTAGLPSGHGEVDGDYSHYIYVWPRVYTDEPQPESQQESAESSQTTGMPILMRSGTLRSLHKGFKRLRTSFSS